MAGIKGMWSLRSSTDTAFDKHLVQSFIGETRILSIENEELAEVYPILCPMYFSCSTLRQLMNFSITPCVDRDRRIQQ